MARGAVSVVRGSQINVLGRKPSFDQTKKEGSGVEERIVLPAVSTALPAQ